MKFRQLLLVEPITLLLAYRVIGQQIEIILFAHLLIVGALG